MSFNDMVDGFLSELLHMRIGIFRLCILELHDVGMQHIADFCLLFSLKTRKPLDFDEKV